MSAPADHRRDRRLAQRLAAWFDAAARDLPWRRRGADGRRDPYRALVSEAMLQQTQASRVAERFERFVAEFPTFKALAEAPEEAVVAAWAGLGYYRRARALHAAARAVMERFGGRLPSDPRDLRRLPGVGPYTAGALASVVFGRPAPMVDGNVQRVLLRLDAVDLPRNDPEAVRWAWARAAEFVGAASSPGRFNEALMELGATVCTPRRPRCASCPLAAGCRAHREGAAASIPRAARAAPRRVVHHTHAVVTDGADRVLLVRRPADGLWGGLWQPPGLEGDEAPAAPGRMRRWLGVGQLGPASRFTHRTTHLEIRFTVLAGRLGAGAGPRFGRFVDRAEAGRLGLSSAHRRALADWIDAAPADPTGPERRTGR